MAFASVGTLGATSDIVAGTSITHAVTVLAAIGSIVIVVVAKDNASTTDGNTNEITSVTDSVGNTWTKAREFCNGQGAANAGCTVAVFYSRLTSQLSVGDPQDTITANFSDSRTASALSAWNFSGTAISVSGGADLANDGAEPGSMSISGIPSAQYLFLRGIAVETAPIIGLTPTTSYTALTEAAGGIGAAGLAIQGEFRILTATGDTSDPLGEVADNASVFVAFKESAAPPDPTKGGAFGGGLRQIIAGD